jgi:putative Ca2+/H+ antiporter (TMEM165/GDT1 family)
MDAIMIALVAVALANADGRAGLFLSRLLTLRGDRRTVLAAAFGGFVVNAVLAAAAGSAANRMIGQGVVALLVALALLSAAGALLWSRRPPEEEAERARGAPGPLLALRLIVAQFGDRSHFLIAALAATSGAGHWAAAGGLIGWALAMLPFLAFGTELAARRSMRLSRLIAAAILALWGIRAGLGAFGLLG